MNDALTILYKSLQNRLLSANSLWGTKVYTETALPNADRPYVIVMFSGGGELNAMRRKDAEFLITIKGVADTMTTALQIASALGEVLNDKGTQDSPNDSLIATGGWEIKTVTQERRVQLVEQFQDVANIYHSGHQFRIAMEKN